MKDIATLLLWCTLTGCCGGAVEAPVPEPPAIRIADVDGGSWSEIACSCESDCFERAGRLCPLGYLVGDSSGAVLAMITSPVHGSVHAYGAKLLVRCVASMMPEDPVPPRRPSE